MHVELVLGQAEELDEHLVGRTLPQGQGYLKTEKQKSMGTCPKVPPSPVWKHQDSHLGRRQRPVPGASGDTRGHPGTHQPGAAALLPGQLNPYLPRPLPPS